MSIKSEFNSLFAEERNRRRFGKSTSVKMLVTWDNELIPVHLFSNSITIISSELNSLLKNSVGAVGWSANRDQVKRMSLLHDCITIIDIVTHQAAFTRMKANR
jgi:hypothetical protein